MNCPRCRLALFPGTAGGATLHACGACGGVWLDTATAVKVSQAAPEGVIELAESAEKHAPHRPDTRPVVPCPVCTGAMQRVKLHGPGVDIDTCGKHGTWYDRDELRAVERSVREQRRKRVGTGVALAGGAALVAGGAVAAAVVAQQQQVQDNRPVMDAIEVGADVVEAAADVADVAGVAAEGGSAIAEGVGSVFELVGGLLSCLDF